jgi:hypothetical protein
LPSRCEPAVIACRKHKKNHELDVVVSADPPGEKSRILAIGEVKAAKWLVGLNQLERLRHIRSLLSVDAIAGEPKLLLFSRQGFTPELAVYFTLALCLLARLPCQGALRSLAGDGAAGLVMSAPTALTAARRRLGKSRWSCCSGGSPGSSWRPATRGRRSAGCS